MAGQRAADLRLVYRAHHDVADTIRQDKMNALMPDFFVLPHGAEQRGHGHCGQPIRQTDQIGRAHV